jgi:mono/diheme cytochrome c family protein
LLKQHCGDCHWGPGSEAEFDLEGYETLDQLLEGRKKWKKVVVRVVANEMPPKDAEALSKPDRQTILAWIDHLLTSVDCTTVNPGRITIRRLNRTEYKNTIRELVGVDYETAETFPGDDVGYGFDNIADVLSLPPILMEKYLRAAEDITSAAIVDPTVPAFRMKVKGEEFTKSPGTSAHDSFHILTTNSTIGYEVELPVTGKYEVVVRAYGDQAGEEPVKMTFGANGTSVGTVAVTAVADEHGDYPFTARLKKGKNRIEVSFTNDFYNPEIGDRNLHLVDVQLTGASGLVSKLQKTLIPESPTDPEEQRLAARKALNQFASRAYRRRVTGEELDRLMTLYDQARVDECFELSIQYAFQAVLVSPHFLYKIESPTPPGKTRFLSEFELATSLSYFLWSSMPDAELLQLASQNKLRTADVYRQQVQRMLQDPKAGELVENFVAQWLQLRHLEDVKPDPDLFPGIDEQMRRDMAQETKLTIADLIKRNASVLEILDTESSFLNERLARHYGIPGIKGERFRKVDTQEFGRVGLMTQASVLTLTSNPTRTSPVKRGKWIMENLLGEVPPPPDPAAMQLEDQAELKGTLRQRMEQHRANPSCAACHKVMDQLGFALENYDAVGRWRDVDEAITIDASGELPDGTVFAGARELQQTMKAKMRDHFVRCITEKMLIYSLGRGLEYFDECSVDKIIKQIEPGNFRFSDLIVAVATSDPFLKRQGQAIDNEEESQEFSRE